MAKISLKKITVAVLSAVGLSALTFGAAGCLPKSTDLTEPENIEISRSAPPADGSLPTAHTCAENLSYIIHVFDHQPQYHTYSYGVTNASIATQTTRNFRDYKDGVLLNTDLTYSSMVKSGTQTCSMYNEEGEYEVYFRTSEAPEADTLPAQAAWSESAPTFFNKKAYNYTYGLLPNELFNYIVNEENIIDSEQIKVNADGTYTQKFTLDPVASTYFYQFGMKTRGGLSGYPEFESITFSVDFDGDWQILSATMHEVSKVNKGIVVTSVSDFNTQYWYGDDHFDEGHYAFYDSYFKNYIDDSGSLEQGGPADGELVIDVPNVLSNGFSQIMNGGAQFEISLDLGANRYVGYIYLSLDLENPLETLALKVSLGKTLREQTLYLEYGNDGLAAYYGKDFALSANLSEVKAKIDELAKIIDDISAAFKKSAQSAPGESVPAVQAEEDDPLTALMNSMELTADEKQAVLTLNTDDLLGLGIGINAKLIFGINNNKITFRSASVGGLAIGGEAVDIGLSLRTTTAPEIGRVPSETGADLADYMADINKLLGADLIKVTAKLDGDGEKVSINALKGLKAEVNAYADVDGVTVGADAYVAYTYKGQQVSAKVGVWYGYDPNENNYGKAIVSLDELNGKPLISALKIKCDIKEVAEAVSTLITFGGNDGSQATDGLVSIVNGALASDFGALLTEMYADKAQIKVGISIDDLLDMLGINAGVKFGSCTLKYARGDEEAVYGGELSATLPALGLDLSVCGEGGAIARPDDTDSLDLAAFINTVKAAMEQVNGIIDNQSVSFEMVEGENFLSLDGIDVGIWGKGEVSWKAGEEYVALDLSMSISEQRVGATDEVHTDVLKFKFIYDKNADNSPLVRLALNEVGIDIYKEDIESVKDGFKSIYNKVMGALGKGGSQTQPTELENGTVAEGVKFTATDKLLGVLFGILADDGWVDELNYLTLSTDGKSVALDYLAKNAFSAELGADGKLSLYYDGAFGERFSLSGGITASATVGDLRDTINEKIIGENVTVSSSKKEGSAPFVKLVYDYLFSAISAIDVSNILGSDTYTVTFNLNGDNSGIKELENVRVRAEIYVTGASEDISGNKQPKLSEANLDIDAAGVVIKLNVITERRNNNTHFYINLSQVMDIKLPDLKFKATQSSLYETFEVLFDAINNTQLLNDAAKLFGLGGTETPAEPEITDKVAEPETDGQLADKLADLITSLLNFDFGSAVTATEIDNVMTAELDLDTLVKGLFDVQTGALGTVEVVINHNNHSMTTRGTNNWISLSSKLAARKDYSKFDRSEYISIEFLPDLIGDLIKVATNDNGNLQTLFTLSGSINARVVNLIDVNIDPCTLTVNIGEDGLWLSLVMHVNKAKVIGIGIPESTVGITYKNGLLTLAKGLNTSIPEYKVVTFEYFMDNMLSGDELLNWLLEISGWNLFKSSLPEISSGLTTTQDVRLYEASTSKEEQEISMYTFVNALSVVIGGNQTAVFGDYGALERDLGVYDNYYGFALNAGAVTNGVLTKLNAAITRTGDGLDRVLASGALQSYVTFSANLQFKNNLTDEYQLGNTLQGGVTAPDLYEKALGIAAENNYVPDFDYFEKNPSQGYDKKFGCMSVTATSGGYSISTQYSNVLYSHTLTIVRANGETEDMLVRHGSTVYLYDNEYPVYSDENKTVRVLYSTSGEVGAASVIMNGDMTVYEVRRAAVTVVVHNGSEEVTVNSFVDDKVPTSVAGLETITRPVYEDGTEVGDNDVIDGSADTVHIYGSFVKTEIVVNYVKYTFSAQTMSYTASGRAAGFNDYYSTKGNTLVLENEIGGYPVTAIAANAFANTDGKAIKSVVAPENIVTVGENAFLENVDMESAVFLAGNVTFLGKDGNSKTMPFYGCSVSGNEEQTALKVYYKNISASGGNWKHFRYVSKVLSYNFYIGDNGGALYGAGWTYVDYAVNVDTNGVTDGTLSEEAVKNILAPYFPYATTGSYEGSLTETNANKALENGIANFTVLRGGITYACSYTAEVKTEGGRTTVTFNVSYKATAEIYVQSSLAFGMYGKNIAADTLTLMTVPVEGEIALPEPSHATHKFVGWTESEVDGKPCYTANWTEKNKYTLTVNIKKGAVDNNNVYLNGENLGKNKTPEIKVYEGTVSISVDSGANRIYITDSANTYYIEVKELSLKGFKYVESGKLRSVTTGDAGDKTVSGNTTITVSY